MTRLEELEAEWLAAYAAWDAKAKAANAAATKAAADAAWSKYAAYKKELENDNN